MVAISAVNVLAVMVILCKWHKDINSLAIAFICIFVGVAMYRSVFVSSYPGLLVWFDTVFNSPFIIRCLATFAEMSFIGIFALVLYKLNKEYPVGKFLSLTPFLGVLFIAVAQYFAFEGLTKQSGIGFIIEEALWAAAFLILIPLVIIRLRLIKMPNISKHQKIAIIAIAAWCFGYGAFQLFYGLPFIHSGYLPMGTAPVGTALQRAVFDFTPTRDFATWGGAGFFIWHGSYFSICSWLLITIVYNTRKFTKPPAKTSQ